MGSATEGSRRAPDKDCPSHLPCREPFWPEQQCWPETPEPTSGMTSACDAHVLEMCVLLMYTSVSSHHIFLPLMLPACGAGMRAGSCAVPVGPLSPTLMDCVVLPLPSALVPCILPVPSSLEPHLSPPPCVCVALHLCVCCVAVLRIQIPTGPLIFNPLQQPQLSQFSPQQSQSATSSPQQQGETVRPPLALTPAWSHFNSE